MYSPNNDTKNDSQRALRVNRLEDIAADQPAVISFDKHERVDAYIPVSNLKDLGDDAALPTYDVHLSNSVSVRQPSSIPSDTAPYPELPGAYPSGASHLSNAYKSAHPREPLDNLASAVPHAGTTVPMPSANDIMKDAGSMVNGVRNAAKDVYDLIDEFVEKTILEKNEAAEPAVTSEMPMGDRSSLDELDVQEKGGKGLSENLDADASSPFFHVPSKNKEASTHVPLPNSALSNFDMDPPNELLQARTPLNTSNDISDSNADTSELFPLLRPDSIKSPASNGMTPTNDRTLFNDMSVTDTSKFISNYTSAEAFDNGTTSKNMSASNKELLPDTHFPIPVPMPRDAGAELRSDSEESDVQPNTPPTHLNALGDEYAKERDHHASGQMGRVGLADEDQRIGSFVPSGTAMNLDNAHAMNVADRSMHFDDSDHMKEQKNSNIRTGPRVVGRDSLPESHARENVRAADSSSSEEDIAPAPIHSHPGRPKWEGRSSSGRGIGLSDGTRSLRHKDSFHERDGVVGQQRRKIPDYASTGGAASAALAAPVVVPLALDAATLDPADGEKVDSNARPTGVKGVAPGYHESEVGTDRYIAHHFNQDVDESNSGPEKVHGDNGANFYDDENDFHAVRTEGLDNYVAPIYPTADSAGIGGSPPRPSRSPARARTPPSPSCPTTVAGGGSPSEEAIRADKRYEAGWNTRGNGEQTSTSPSGSPRNLNTTRGSGSEGDYTMSRTGMLADHAYAPGYEKRGKDYVEGRADRGDARSRSSSGSGDSAEKRGLSKLVAKVKGKLL